MSSAFDSFRALMRGRPVILAPMEDVSDPVFRRLCRGVGAELCVTEFVNAENLLEGAEKAERKIALAPNDRPTAIQIYGANPARLEEAARLAEQAGPSFIDINCGCWVPSIVARGAGAGWLRDPDAMVAMAKRVVAAVGLPVTVKTRIGWGPESQMPIVELSQALEQAGVAALTIHCRTAQMRHNGKADWRWAARAKAAVKIPVIVNGDIATAEDCVRAFHETGCDGVMIGRGAIAYPWVFREARALLDRGVRLSPATALERLEFLKLQLRDNVALRGESNGVQCVRRHLRGYLDGLPGGVSLRQQMYRTPALADTLELLERATELRTANAP